MKSVKERKQQLITDFMRNTPRRPESALGRLKVWHLNIRGLRNSLNALCGALEHEQPDVLGLSETKLPKAEKPPYIPGYTFVYNSHKSGMGGTAIYAREDLNLAAYIPRT